MLLRENGCLFWLSYEGVSKIFRTDAVKIINLTTKRVWKLRTSTQLRATWHTDPLDMVVLASNGASRYHNFCINGGASPEYFGYALVRKVSKLASVCNVPNFLKSCVKHAQYFNINLTAQQSPAFLCGNYQFYTHHIVTAQQSPALLCAGNLVSLTTCTLITATAQQSLSLLCGTQHAPRHIM
jgi:hypothetical protein